LRDTAEVRETTSSMDEVEEGHFIVSPSGSLTREDPELFNIEDVTPENPKRPASAPLTSQGYDVERRRSVKEDRETEADEALTAVTSVSITRRIQKIC